MSSICVRAAAKYPAALAALAIMALTLLVAAPEPTAAAVLTERMSVSSAEAQATGGGSAGASITPDGRYVAFYSNATNLVAGDTNGLYDIFVRDRLLGTTTRVNVATGGAQATGGASFAPSISADGRFVSFQSRATNLVTGDTNGLMDIFVHDRSAGTTSRVSVTSGGAQVTGGESVSSSISADGRFVAFGSYATNLVVGDTNNHSDIFVRDRWAGTTTRWSVTGPGGQALNGDSGSPSISADGTRVTFDSYATNLVSGDTNVKWDIFVRDGRAGTTSRASVSSSGAQAASHSYAPSISANGRYVAFESSTNDLVPGDTNASSDVFVRDTLSGVTKRVSLTSSGAQASSHSYAASISADGRYVAFDSDATNLVSGDTNGQRDVFVHDRVRATTRRASISASGGQSNAGSHLSSVSADGRRVAFESYASTLVSNDTNGELDVFVQTGPAYTVRLADRTRFSTAVAIARDGFPGWAGVKHVVIASGDDRAAADPLAASGLCWAYDAPMLLVSAARTPDEVKVAVKEIVQANGPVTLHVVGGPISVPDARLNEIRAYVGAASVGVDRLLATGSRYDMAAAIARRMRYVADADPAKFMPLAALFANGADSTKFFDALALSPISASTGAPILLVTATSIPPATKAYVTEFDP